jgi:hypothetical protein
MTIVRGDTKNFTVTVKDSDGDPFDLTSYTMVMTVKTDVDQLDDDATFQSTATITSPETGVGTFKLLPSETDVTPGKYIYDIQISDGTTNVYTIVQKTELIIVADVTRGV